MLLKPEDIEREKGLPYDRTLDEASIARAIEWYVPEWTLPEYKEDRHFNGGAVAGAAFFSTKKEERGGSRPRESIADASAKPVDVVTDTRIRRSPSMKYIRAVDPQGNIVPLVVSTVNASPDFPGGDDGLGTDQRVRAEKQRRGWLILEKGQYGYNGTTGLAYLQWALAVADDRRKRHLEWEKSEREALMSRAEKQSLALQEKQVDAQKDTTAALVDLVSKLIESQKDSSVTVAEAVAKAMLKNKKGE